MISIILKNNKIVLTEIQPLKKSVLHNPLHILFIRNYLSGTKDENEQVWVIPFEDESTIKTLIGHLNKYGIEYQLDKQCIGIIEEDKREKREFLLLLRESENAKSNFSNTIKDQLIKKLTPEFKRALTLEQLKAIFHLLNIRNGANFSVPGSGKTSIALAYYLLLKKEFIIDTLVILGPISVFEPWENEYYSCFEKSPNSIRIAGNTRSVRKQIYVTFRHYEVFLTTYHSAAKDIKELKLLLQNTKSLLILDESHYIKKPQGGILAETILELAKYAKRRVILTGTPMPNGLSDLWSQITFLWYNRLPLGDATSYLKEIDKVDTRLELDVIKSRINPFFFRITKSQLKLPKQQFHVISCQMAPIQAKIYRGIAERFLTQLNLKPDDKETLRGLRRARAIRLLQIASNPSLLMHDCVEFLIPPIDASDFSIKEVIENYPKIEIPSKIVGLIKLVNEICSTGRKVIVWTTFIHNLFMLEELLKKFNPIVLYGGIPYQNNENSIEITREKLIARFKKDDNCMVMLANPAACAESISLHMVCRVAIYLDRSFNCAHYIQSQDRIHRLGLKQNEDVNYYLFQEENSIDQIVDLRLVVKMNNMSHIIEGDLPENMPGYWSNYLGDEEDVDYDKVDEHIRNLFTKR